MHVSAGSVSFPCATKDSYPDLARAFGGKHHTTVISAVQKAFAARFKKLCGKGAVYVVDDSTWHNYEHAGRVYRNYSGRCWERNVSFSSR